MALPFAASSGVIPLEQEDANAATAPNKNANKITFLIQITFVLLIKKNDAQIGAKVCTEDIKKLFRDIMVVKNYTTEDLQIYYAVFNNHARNLLIFR